MEEVELKTIWQTYQQKLDRSLQLNARLVREIQTTKVRSEMNRFTSGHVVAVIMGVFWIALLVFLIWHSTSNIYFCISAGMIALFNVFAVAIYLKYIIDVRGINISESITEAQQKLATVQASFNNIGRVLFLQTPFYCTFWYTDELVANGGPVFWTIQLLIVSFFTILSIHLYRSVTPQNIHKKWVRVLVESFGGKRLSKAMEFLKELETYKRDTV